jgi:uncharacterized small protein (DUF1192 family)
MKKEVVEKNTEKRRRRIMSVYKVKRNRCDCHPETCSCAPWVVFKDGERILSLMDKDMAEDVAETLNNFESIETEVDVLKAEIARLKAEKTARCMDSAPKDGSFILIWDGWRKDWFKASWRHALDLFDGRWFDYKSWTHDEEHIEVTEPLFWLPLPSTPKYCGICCQYARGKCECDGHSFERKESYDIACSDYEPKEIKESNG